MHVHMAMAVMALAVMIGRHPGPGLLLGRFAMMHVMMGVMVISGRGRCRRRRMGVNVVGQNRRRRQHNRCCRRKDGCLLHCRVAPDGRFGIKKTARKYSFSAAYNIKILDSPL